MIAELTFIISNFFITSLSTAESRPLPAKCHTASSSRPSAAKSLSWKKLSERKLFHRRPFGLTPAGDRLFAEIEKFFAGLRDLPHQVRGHAVRRLRVAAPAMILRDYLPKIFADYKRQSRDFQLTLRDANQASAEDLLRKQEIDLAITELDDRPASTIRCLVLLRLPLVLIVPARSPFRNLENLFRDGSPTQNLISLASDEVITKHFRSGLRKRGLSWTTAIEVSSLDLIDLYSSLGFGIGLSIKVPGSSIRAGMRQLPLQKFPPLTIAALWRGDLSETATIFLTSVRRSCQSTRSVTIQDSLALA